MAKALTRNSTMLSPSNEDQTEAKQSPSSGTLSCSDIGLKVYEVLTALPFPSRAILAKAIFREKNCEEMKNDKKLSAILRQLRYPLEGASPTKNTSRHFKMVTNR